jgi:AraC-like DNA-binding protein
MRYQKIKPAPHLAPFVECYFVWENRDPLLQPLRIESPPSGFASMVFNYSDAYHVRTEKSSQPAPMAFLSGQSTHQYELELTGRIGMAGIVFKPAGLNTLFGLPMYEFSNERIAITDVFGAGHERPDVSFLAEQVANCTTDTERVAVLEGFLNRQLLRRGNRFDRTDYVANLIVDKRGVLNVSELENDLYVCRRQFERQFLQKVGVSPKYYARIRRVGYVCAELAAKRWQITDWQDLIYQCGYYDQSHFIRDFTQFTGKRPSIYLKDNAELTQYL